MDAGGTWDTSKVRSMEIMFANAKDFNQPLSAWGALKGVDTRHMFSRVSSCTVTASGPRCNADDL